MNARKGRGKRRKKRKNLLFKIYFILFFLNDAFPNDEEKTFPSIELNDSYLLI